MRVAIVGAGYVGLTTGACLAELGHSVICVDVDADRIDRLASGDLPIFEPGLSTLVRNNLARQRLAFCTGLASSAQQADAVFLAVGTPSRKNGEIDLAYVEAAAVEVARAASPGTVIVVKSTVIAGTCHRLREMIRRERPGTDLSVASNPEFLREGSAVNDFMRPDRIVIGADDEHARQLLCALYGTFRLRNVPLVITTTKDAEMIKYASNAFLALKIGFINDVADLCERIGGDAATVAEGVGLDRRIGAAFLTPGPGFGGSCFPKDTRAFAFMGRANGAPQILVEQLIESNEHRKRAVAGKILTALNGACKGAVVAVFGVAFKANTDDVRESATLAVVPILQQAGISVRAHDPQAMLQGARHLDAVEWCDSPYDAARDADAVVVLTEWNEFRALDLARLAAAMRGRILLDFRNVFLAEDVVAHGFWYLSVGRPPRDGYALGTARASA